MRPLNEFGDLAAKLRYRPPGGEAGPILSYRASLVNRCLLPNRSTGSILGLVSARPIQHRVNRRSQHRRWRGSLAALAVLAAIPRVSAADSDVDEIERWVPALSVYFDAFGQKASGSVTSGDVLGPPISEGGCLLEPRNNQPPTRNGAMCPPAGIQDRPDKRAPRKIQPDSEGSDTNVVPSVGGSLELMTPRLFEPLFSPRLFVHGDFAAAFGFERSVAGTGAPGEFKPPEDNPNDDIPEEGVDGQGTRTKVQLKRWVWSGGGGIAFSFKLFDHRLRIKPSFEYTRYDIDLIGSVRRAVKRQQRTTAPNTTLKPEEWHLISLEFTDEQTREGFGPGLELEADTANIGPFLMSVFFYGRGYYYPGKRDYSYTQINEFGETASWTINLEPWSWRGGVGLRFRWVPLSE